MKNITVKENSAREHRIIYEIVIDAYGSEERALGWYYYMENALEFPFQAICMNVYPNSPLRKNEETRVVGMQSEENCKNEIFVTIEFDERTTSVPLSQLSPLSVSQKAHEAIEDWQYWIARGYQF